jgi:hypothetical protein
MECMNEKCAWWVEKECAMAVLAKAENYLVAEVDRNVKEEMENLEESLRKGMLDDDNE